MNKAKVKKITIELANGKTIKLSRDEARDLYQELRELFGDNKVHFLPYTAPTKSSNPYDVTIYRGTSTSSDIPDRWLELDYTGTSKVDYNTKKARGIKP